MIVNFFKKWFSIKRAPLDEALFKTTLKASKRRREEAQKKIDGMMATLDGCGDQWFIQPAVTIDECPPPKKSNGEANT